MKISIGDIFFLSENNDIEKVYYITKIDFKTVYYIIINKKTTAIHNSYCEREYLELFFTQKGYIYQSIADY